MFPYLVLVLVALGGIACSTGSPGGNINPNPVQSSAISKDVPAARMLLEGRESSSYFARDMVLFVDLDLQKVDGWLVLQGRRFPLVEPRLDLLTASVLPGQPKKLRASYRLRFAIDDCQRSERTSIACQSGRLLLPYELLVDRDSFDYSQDPNPDISYLDVRHSVVASCVPASGNGPSCHLLGNNAPSQDTLHQILKQLDAKSHDPQIPH